MRRESRERGREGGKKKVSDKIPFPRNGRVSFMQPRSVAVSRRDNPEGVGSDSSPEALVPGQASGGGVFPGIGGVFPGRRRQVSPELRHVRTFRHAFFSWLPFFRHSGVSVRRFEAFSILFCRSFRPLPAFCRAAAFPGFGIFAVSGPFRRPGAGGAVLSFPADGRRSARACRGRRARGRRGGRG